MVPLNWQETVTYLGVFVVWYAGLTGFYNLGLKWFFFPWTLLCAALIYLIWYLLPLINDYIGVVAVQTLVGCFIGIDLLVPGAVGWIMFRSGGKWSKAGVALIVAVLIAIAGWMSFLVYAAVTGFNIGFLT